jgi:hypothetical protein
MQDSPNSSPPRLKNIINEMGNDFPSPEVLKNPIDYANKHKALPANFTNFIFHAFEHFMHPQEMLYGGMVCCNTWDMGRPAKRMRSLPRSQQQHMKDKFQNAMSNEMASALTACYLEDPNSELIWVFTINIMDPITQNPKNRHNIDKCSNHLVLCLVHAENVYVVDPLGAKSSSLHTVNKVLLTAAVQAVTSITTGIHYTAMQTRDHPPMVQCLDEHTCVLWCAWFCYNYISWHQFFPIYLDLNEVPNAKDLDDELHFITSIIQNHAGLIKTLMQALSEQVRLIQ